MEKIFITILVSTLLFANKANAKVISKPRGFYAHMAIVTKVKPKRNGTYKISAKDAADRKWSWLDDDGDWYKGDFAALLMYDNGTENVYDDQIVDARYVGVMEFFK